MDVPRQPIQARYDQRAARLLVVDGIDLQPVSAVTLPQTAVLADEKGSYVLVVNPSDKVERRPVHVSGISDAGAIISGGLTGQERVVATAAGFLRDGEQVKVAAPATAAQTK